MNIIVRLTKVESKILKELRERDKRCGKGLEGTAKSDLSSGCKRS